MPAAVRALSRALVLLLALTLTACADDGRLVVKSANGDHAFSVEVVDTDAGRQKGLMFRQQLAPDSGMLFDFRQSREVAFWMQNTFIPLDMLFIRADGTIANIKVNAKPFDTTPVPSAGPVMFVLEVPGGRTKELGIAAGEKVEHDRVKAAAAVAP